MEEGGRKPGWATPPGGGDKREEGSHVDRQGQCGRHVGSKAKATDEAGVGQVLGRRDLPFVPRGRGPEAVEGERRFWFSWRDSSRLLSEEGVGRPRAPTGRAAGGLRGPDEEPEGLREG